MVERIARKKNLRIRPSVQYPAYITKRPVFARPSPVLFKKWRKDCGFTQAEAAYRLGIGIITYRRIEWGKTTLRGDTWLACRALWLQCDVGQTWLVNQCGGKHKFAKLLKAYFEATDYKIKEPPSADPQKA